MVQDSRGIAKLFPCCPETPMAARFNVDARKPLSGCQIQHTDAEFPYDVA